MKQLWGRLLFGQTGIRYSLWVIMTPFKNLISRLSENYFQVQIKGRPVLKKMARASLCVAQNAPTYRSRLQKQLLNSVRETIGSIWNPLIFIGENYLYCLNQNIWRLFSTDKQKLFKQFWIGRHRHRKTIQTPPHYTNKHKYTARNQKKTFYQILFLEIHQTQVSSLHLGILCCL